MAIESPIFVSRLSRSVCKRARDELYESPVGRSSIARALLRVLCLEWCVLRSRGDGHRPGPCCGCG